MIYVITYDISDDKIRTNIAKYLGGQGQRVQESVFECKSNQKQLNIIINKLNEIIGNQGNIRIYPLCQECYKKVIGIGETKNLIGKDGYAIF